MSDNQDSPVLGRNPCKVNGRTTPNAYLVVATRTDVKSYNAVGVRKLGENEFKFHLWPNARVLGLSAFLEEHHPGEMYHRQRGISATDYTGVVLSRADTEQFLDHIKSKDTLNVAKREHVMQVLDGGCDPYGGCVHHNVPAGSIDFSEFGDEEDESSLGDDVE